MIAAEPVDAVVALGAAEIGVATDGVGFQRCTSDERFDEA